MYKRGNSLKKLRPKPTIFLRKLFTNFNDEAGVRTEEKVTYL